MRKGHVDDLLRVRGPVRHRDRTCLGIGVLLGIGALLGIASPFRDRCKDGVRHVG